MNAWFGEEAITLIARNGRKALVLTTAKKAVTTNSVKMDRFENVEVSTSDLVAGQFIGPGQVLCVLNATGVLHSCSVSFPLRDPSLGKHLAADLQEFDPLTGHWFNVERTRILPLMQLKTSVEPFGWRVFRLVPP